MDYSENVPKNYKLVRRGYTYTRRYLIRKYYRKIKGKRRLIRAYRTVTIRVLPKFIYLAPKRAKKKAKPKRKAPKKIRPITITPYKGWFRVPDFIRALELEHEAEIEVEDELIRDKRKPQKAHWVRGFDRLLWERPRNPEMDFDIAVLSVWALVYDTRKRRYFIISRSRAYGSRQEGYQRMLSAPASYRRRKLIPSPKNWAELLFLKDDLFTQFSDWIGKYDYLEERGMVAWSWWAFPMYMPRTHKKKRKKRK